MYMKNTVVASLGARGGGKSNGAAVRLHPGLPPIGSKNKWAKLIEADVTEIRRLRLVGRKLAEIAVLFNVSIQAISHIINGKTWKRHP
jgi:hypothetical protein